MNENPYAAPIIDAEPVEPRKPKRPMFPWVSGLLLVGLVAFLWNDYATYQAGSELVPASVTRTLVVLLPLVASYFLIRAGIYLRSLAT